MQKRETRQRLSFLPYKAGSVFDFRRKSGFGELTCHVLGVSAAGGIDFGQDDGEAAAEIGLPGQDIVQSIEVITVPILPRAMARRRTEYSSRRSRQAERSSVT